MAERNEMIQGLKERIAEHDLVGPIIHNIDSSVLIRRQIQFYVQALDTINVD